MNDTLANLILAAVFALSVWIGLAWYEGRSR